MSGKTGRSLNENIARNLRMIYEFRYNREKSLEEFSSELGIGHTTLQNIFHKKSNLRLDTVEIIAENLKTSPLRLLSDQYPKSDLTCGVLLLEVAEVFQGFSPEKRRKVTTLFCQLLEELAEEEPEKHSPDDIPLDRTVE